MTSSVPGPDGRSRRGGRLPVLLLGLAIWAWWWPALCRPVAVAWLVEGTVHLAYHVGHLEGLGGADRIGLVVSLAFVLVLAVAALVMERGADDGLG